MSAGAINVTFLDVGVGDATAITFTEGGVRRCILVDGGDNTRATRVVADHLAKEGVGAIDLLVATHFDQDHIRGLTYLLRDMADGKGPLANKRVRNYWGPMPARAGLLVQPTRALSPAARFVVQSVAQNEELLKEVRRCVEDSGAIRFPSVADPPPLDLFSTFRINLLAPERQVPADEVQRAATEVPAREIPGAARGFTRLEDLRKAVARIQDASAVRADHTANNLSIVVRLTPTARLLQKWRILLTGDAEEESWSTMLARRRPVSARILKVSHHGATEGTPKWVVPKIRPRYSVISVGQRHGHPTREAYHALLQSGNDIFVTEKNRGRKASGCREFRCPKSENPGSLSIRMEAKPLKVSVVPDNAFCTRALRTNLQ